MLNEKEIIILILSFNTVLLLVGGIIFAIACLYQRELLIWMPVFITLTIGYFFFLYQLIDITYQLIANMLFVVAAIFTFTAAFIEYYQLFIKSTSQKSHAINFMMVMVVISPIILGFQILVIGLLIATIIMLIRIYLRNKSITRMFFLVSIIAATFAMSFIFLDNYGVEGALIFGNIIVTSYTSILAVSGIVAMLEQKINRTIKEKNNLKDKFSHDLGNILHSMSLTYELIRGKSISEKELTEVYSLLKNKIYEASDLVKEIRKL